MSMWIFFQLALSWKYIYNIFVVVLKTCLVRKTSLRVFKLSCITNIGNRIICRYCHSICVKTKNVQMNYWGYKYRGMFKSKMIHVSSYPMLQNGGGVNIALCEPRSTILVKGRLIYLQQ